MYGLRQILETAAVNFRNWRKNPKIVLVFCLEFIICYLLSDKVLQFAKTHGTALQILEPFIWTFGDADAVMLVSMPLLLMFSDMPCLGNEVPFYLIRTSRKRWLLGQIVYLICASLIFMSAALLFTCLLSGANGYIADLWSDTAAILGYSSIGETIAVPAFVKVLELSFPYKCALHIFGLMLGYALVMAAIMLFINLWKGRGGMIGGIVYCAFGFVMNPEILAAFMNLPGELMRYANILFGWISPLNQATYYMHNFGYDNLPRLWMSYVFFATVSFLLFLISVQRIKRYPFSFTGTGR